MAGIWLSNYTNQEIVQRTKNHCLCFYCCLGALLFLLFMQHELDRAKKSLSCSVLDSWKLLDLYTEETFCTIVFLILPLPSHGGFGHSMFLLSTKTSLHSWEMQWAHNHLQSQQKSQWGRSCIHCPQHPRNHSVLIVTSCQFGKDLKSVMLCCTWAWGGIHFCWFCWGECIELDTIQCLWFLHIFIFATTVLETFNCVLIAAWLWSNLVHISQTHNQSLTSTQIHEDRLLNDSRFCKSQIFFWRWALVCARDWQWVF